MPHHCQGTDLVMEDYVLLTSRLGLCQW